MKTALITGASSGLGTEFARIHASNGENLVLIARSRNKMEALKTELQQQHHISVYIIEKDLSDPTAPKEIFEELKEQAINIDYLINNAGFGDFGQFASCNWDKQLQMINLNIVALTSLTHLFLPGMIERRNGRILNIASTAAFQPGPTMSVYFATKAFVLNFSEAIANELSGSGVSVTTLCPGPTSTGFKKLAALDKSGLFNNSRVASPVTVARFGHKAMMRGKTVAVHGSINRLQTILVSFAPRKVVAHATRLLLQEK